MFSTLKEAENFFTERKKLGIKPGLERIEKLLALLSHPERKFQAIHVAGTNGKGSTIHFVHAVLKANGYHTGVFTSPSFSGLLGHIFLNDKTIDEMEFITILNELYPFIKKLDNINESPTEFEIITALAYVFFAKCCDIVLVETGMGGRYDTTNTCEPILSIITNVSRDHTDYLGDSLQAIANHKAGIIKSQTPVIVGDMEKSALQVISLEAEEKNAPILKLFTDFHYDTLLNPEIIIWKSSNREHSFKLQMAGEHQVKNASVALKAIEELEEFGYVINWRKALAAMENQSLPGRFEVLNENPVVIVDAAHNYAGVRAFIKTINEKNGSKNHVLIGMFADKDTKEMLELLSKHFERITVTTFDHPRAATVEDLYRQLGNKNIQQAMDWKVELERLLEEGKPFYITGSLHFILLVREYFVEKNKIM